MKIPHNVRSVVGIPGESIIELNPKARVELDPREKVSVYWNLQKRMWSIKQKGFVVAHSRSISLKNCYPEVQPAGQRRVVKEGRKNVHAWITGYIATGFNDRFMESGREYGTYKVSYDPYKAPAFRLARVDSITQYEAILEGSEAYMGYVFMTSVPGLDFRARPLALCTSHGAWWRWNEVQQEEWEAA